jgi:hypothetical protein
MFILRGHICVALARDFIYSTIIVTWGSELVPHRTIIVTNLDLLNNSLALQENLTLPLARISSVGQNFFLQKIRSYPAPDKSYPAQQTVDHF